MKCLFRCWLICIGISNMVNAQVVISLLNDSKTLYKNSQQFTDGKSVSLFNPQFTGESESIGMFNDSSNMLGFKSAIIMGTGRVEIMAGNNSRPNAGANFGHHFFKDRNFTSKATMCDGAILEFDFIPMFDSISLCLVFASEEYPEFIAKEYTDEFTCLLSNKQTRKNPKNIALLPDGKKINVLTINQQNHSELYVDNDNFDKPHYTKIEYDGYTKPIYIGAKVKAKQRHHLKIIIADVDDCEYDSVLLLKHKSFKSIPTFQSKTKPTK